jgi:hypothetical protein
VPSESNVGGSFAWRRSVMSVSYKLNSDTVFV